MNITTKEPNQIKVYLFRLVMRVKCFFGCHIPFVGNKTVVYKNGKWFVSCMCGKVKNESSSGGVISWVSDGGYGQFTVTKK